MTERLCLADPADQWPGYEGLGLTCVLPPGHVGQHKARPLDTKSDFSLRWGGADEDAKNIREVVQRAIRIGDQTMRQIEIDPAMSYQDEGAVAARGTYYATCAVAAALLDVADAIREAAGKRG